MKHAQNLGACAPNATEIVTGVELHDRVIVDKVLTAERTVWIATANLKDMHIAMARGFKPVLEAFEQMSKAGVHFRVIHAETPSRHFRDTLEQCRELLAGGLELQICPRSHWKMVIVDNRFAYLGSANFTGAGLGIKKPERRNIELGVITEDRVWVDRLATLFDNFWIGEHCRDCAYKKECSDPIVTQSRSQGGT
jgi:phosphatidylserine/phosphatidylglycerophosphate/cardiolipin synthase-like enzyme